jgi:hypothetical protein
MWDTEAVGQQRKVARFLACSFKEFANLHQGTSGLVLKDSTLCGKPVLKRSTWEVSCFACKVKAAVEGALGVLPK